MQLSEKEKMLLKDLLSEEQHCIEKYTKASSAANDAGLKNLFTEIAQSEQTHYDTLNSINNGTVPNVNSGNETKPKAPASPSNCNEQDKQQDKFLCADALNIEKHVSSMYNTSIFEFCSPELRNVLNHIQKEEQQHGQELYNYMSTNNMYN